MALPGRGDGRDITPFWVTSGFADHAAVCESLPTAKNLGIRSLKQSRHGTDADLYRSTCVPSLRFSSRCLIPHVGSSIGLPNSSTTWHSNQSAEIGCLGNSVSAIARIAL